MIRLKIDFKKLLKYIPNETQIVIAGDSCCWFHITENKSTICLDVEELDEVYGKEDETPCDYGECPYDAQSSFDCRHFCGLGVDD